MSIWEITGYGLSLIGISFILWMSVRAIIRYLKSKGILKEKKFALKPWKKKETQENEQIKMGNSL